VKELQGKPFALIGVNVNAYDAKQLKAVMVKENLNWRSTADQGAIAEKWNSPGTPVYYVIDPAGVIRYKWVGNPGEKALDAALDKLIQQAANDAE
jgi:peroxiredoxin